MLIWYFATAESIWDWTSTNNLQNIHIIISKEPKIKKNKEKNWQFFFGRSKQNKWNMIWIKVIGYYVSVKGLFSVKLKFKHNLEQWFTTFLHCEQKHYVNSFPQTTLSHPLWNDDTSAKTWRSERKGLLLFDSPQLAYFQLPVSHPTFWSQF